jgi:type I restriction-modification system DNA methylase subunit
VPPAGNANYAWVQHFIHHLAPTGMAGFVLANGSMSSNQSGEGEIRKAIIEADLVDCMVALPGQLFYSTQIPVCLWFLARNKKNPLSRARDRFRDRRGETLFIDARKMGTAGRPHPSRADRRRHRQKIAGTYHAWRGDKGRGRVRRRPRVLQGRHSRRSASTATSSRPAATSAPKLPKTTASRSTRRCSGSPRRCASSRPRPRSSMPPSPPI